MGKVKNFFGYSAVQIFIACLLPNLGAWIIFIILKDKIQEREDEVRVKSFLDPPEWVGNSKEICSESSSELWLIDCVDTFYLLIDELI
jgi:hypothetical protein